MKTKNATVFILRKKMKTSKVKSLDKSLLALGFHLDKESNESKTKNMAL